MAQTGNSNCKSYINPIRKLITPN